MSSWKLSALLSGIVASVIASVVVGQLDLQPSFWTSLVAFFAVALAVIAVLTWWLVPVEGRLAKKSRVGFRRHVDPPPQRSRQ